MNSVGYLCAYILYKMQYDLFKHLMSEIHEYKKNPLIFLAPLPRYLEEGCYSGQVHALNRKQADYKKQRKKQEEAVFAARQNIKNVSFRRTAWMRNSKHMGESLPR
jgi:hypothetical protein